MTEQEIGKGIQINPSSWKIELSASLDAFVRSDHPTRESFIDLLWDGAILDRIAPIDPKVAVLRKSEGRAVFEGGRENPQLYWRIMYAAAGCIGNIAMDATMICAPDNYVAAVYPALHRLSEDNIFGAIYPDPQSRMLDVTDDIILRAKSEIIKATGDPESLVGHPLGCGAEGVWHGMEVRVNGFAGDGTVAFQAANRNDHERIYTESRNRGTVFPWTIDPKAFKLPGLKQQG